MGEAESLQPRQVRKKLIHYSKTKSSKNRTILISDDLDKRLQKAMPFTLRTKSSGVQSMRFNWTCLRGN